MNERVRKKGWVGEIYVFMFFSGLLAAVGLTQESSWIKSTGKRATRPSLSTLGSKQVQWGVDRSSLLMLISEQYSRISYYDGNLNVDENDCSQTSIYRRLSVKRHRQGPRVRDDDELKEPLQELNPTVCPEMAPTYKRPCSKGVYMCVCASLSTGSYGK